MSLVVQEDDELNLDIFDFDFGIDVDELKPLDPIKVVKRRKCSSTHVGSGPVKNDIRRYIPQLLLSVLNTIEFDKLLTFFHTFMASDSAYLLEYIVHSKYVQNPSRFSESRGPELTAFMFTGYGALFPDMTLTANDIRISTNNTNPITKITMNCGFNFTKIYDVTVEWALTQLQGVFHSYQPNPHKDLQFRSTTQQIDGLNLEAKKNKVALKKKLGNEAKTSNAFIGIGGRINSAGGLPYSSSLLPVHTVPAPKPFHPNDHPIPPSTPRPPASTKGDSRSGKYDLTGLAYSIFDHLPRVTPKACFAECTYTIYLDADNRIKNIAVTAVQPPPVSVPVLVPAGVLPEILPASGSTEPSQAW